MAWPYAFTSVQNSTGAMLDANFNAAAQLGTEVTFSGIDNTPIGSTTPAAGTFTEIKGTGIDNTPIGATTPAAGTFTLLALPIQQPGQPVFAAVIANPSTTIAQITATGAASETLLYMQTDSTSSVYLRFANGSGATNGSITTNGSNVSYNTTSDANLKAIHGAADGSPLSALPVRDASFLADPAIRHPMLIAQEVAAVAPWAITLGDGTPEHPDMIDHGSLVPAMLAYIQHCEARIAALEAAAKVAALTPTPAARAASTALAAVIASPVIQAALARGASGALTNGPSVVTPAP